MSDSHLAEVEWCTAVIKIFYTVKVGFLRLFFWLADFGFSFIRCPKRQVISQQLHNERGILILSSPKVSN